MSQKEQIKIICNEIYNNGNSKNDMIDQPVIQKICEMVVFA